MKPIQVGLLGIGTVAAASSTSCSATSRRSSAAPGAASRSQWWPTSTPRGPRPSPAARRKSSRTPREVLADPDIDIVIELIGGYGIARQLMMEAIAAGKHVVTANKALLAVHAPRSSRRPTSAA